MAFLIPSVKELANQVRTSFKSEMPSTDSWLWANFLTVCSKVFAGIVWSLYGRLKWIDKQRFAMTATGYELERHGTEIGITRKPAAYAAGSLTVTGTASTGALTITIPVGAIFTRSDGVSYTSTIAVDMSLAGTATIPVVASVTGTNSNSIYGTSVASSDSNILTATVDSSGIGGGSTIETYEELRARILFKKRNPPQGGALSDYVIWATSVAGVTRAFIDSGEACGAGIVVVYPMFDVDNASNYGLPTTTNLANVQAYLDTVKPVTARVIVASPAPYPIDVEISDLTPTSIAMRQAASDEVYNMVYRNAKVTTSKYTNIVHRSWIWQAVASVSGQQYFQIKSPAADITLTAGFIPVVRSVTFS